jgi:IS30 family transposase
MLEQRESRGLETLAYRGINKWYWSSIKQEDPASVFGVLRLFGGYQPAQRARRARSLSTLAREAISRGLVSGHLVREIAEELNRTPSTIIREMKRNGGVALYRAVRDDAQAWSRSRRPKLCTSALNGRPWLIVASKLS